MPDSLRIMIVDQNVMRASILEDGLREAGYGNLTVVRDMQNLLRHIVEADPEVIFIDLENPNRDVLEQMFQVSRAVQRPVAMFVDSSDASMIEKAVEAGVGAYIVDGLSKERIKPILDMTISRFNAFNKLAQRAGSHAAGARRAQVDRPRQGDPVEGAWLDRRRGLLTHAQGRHEREPAARPGCAEHRNRGKDPEVTTNVRRFGRVPSTA